MIDPNHFHDLPDSSMRMNVTAVFNASKALYRNPAENDQEGDEMLANLPGFELVAPSNFGNKESECGEYVFGDVLQKKWCSPAEGYRRQVDLYRLSSLGWLAFEGFGSIATPTEGSVVVYGFKKPKLRTINAMHYGIVVGEDRVRSRFSSGPVLEHPLHAIPNYWGDAFVAITES